MAVYAIGASWWRTEEDWRWWLLILWSRLSQAKEAAAGKKKIIAKSLIIFEVKPYDAETDLDALAKEILKIEQDGLVWKPEYKKEPIAYGVHKL